MRHLLCLLCVAALVSCGGSGGDADDEPREMADDGPSEENAPDTDTGIDESVEDDLAGTNVDCSVAAQNRWVDANMRDYYLFHDQVPVVNLDDYDSPETLIRDLRVQPFDRFSRVDDIDVDDAFFEEGREVWFGYSWRRHGDGTARIAYVYDDSPMGRAGVRRADRIVSLDGMPWDEIDGEMFDEIVGTTESPNMTRWVLVRESDGTTYTIDVAMEEYSINTVLTAKTYEHPDHDGVIGYLAYRVFLETSAAELDAVMREFRSRGVTDLVLDLRYNGGGRISMARKLSSQIAGPGTDGEPFVQYRFNDRYRENDFELFFEPEPLGLGLDRVMALTTESTASASEMVLNGLRAYVPVTLFGEEITRGKPYITYDEDLEPCGKRMLALEAETFNASGVSVAGGLTPDCAASDDLASGFGIGESGEVEGMLGAAIDFLVSGRCDAPTVLASRSAIRSAGDDVGRGPERGGAIVTGRRR